MRSFHLIFALVLFFLRGKSILAGGCARCRRRPPSAAMITAVSQSSCRRPCRRGVSCGAEDAKIQQLDLSPWIQYWRPTPFSTNRLMASQTLDIEATTTYTKSGQRPFQLLLVESPSKIATIDAILSKYVQEHNLPHDYQVAACYGHVRNLPKSSQFARKSDRFPYVIAGIDLANHYQPIYTLLPTQIARVASLKARAHQASHVWLATDPDREGEAMAWHLVEVLQLETYGRISFAEITASAITSALQHASVQLNWNLVHAQETRRILDRLAGFTVSPLLWKRVSPGLSAGRVQSVALSLCVQREMERLVFVSTDYWTVHVQVEHITAQLTHVNHTAVANKGSDFSPQGGLLTAQKGQKLHLREADATKLVSWLQDPSTIWSVVNMTSTQRSNSPPLPFRTATLQQEAQGQLGYSLQQTMGIAQQLYEQGFISYMRTDATHLSAEAQTARQAKILSEFGAAAVGSGISEARGASTKKSTKFAQESHEAIRPVVKTGGFEEPSQVPAPLRDFYRLVYERTLASGMATQIVNQTSIVFQASKNDKVALFRASASMIISPGYTLAYRGRSGHNNDTSANRVLRSNWKVGHVFTDASPNITATSHTTQPPCRYTEASLVHALETLGVGRPSTFAGIVQILRDRSYVGNPGIRNSARRRGGQPSKAVTGSALSARRAAGGDEFVQGGMRGPLVPSLTAFVVCDLLKNHCPAYVDPIFTANMEERLDHIASGDFSSEEERIAYLDEFYAGENGLAATIKRIEDHVDSSNLRRVRLPALSDASTDSSQIGLFVGPWGPYIQNLTDDNCSVPLPPGLATDVASITPSRIEALLFMKKEGGVVLGTHPDDGRNIRLKTGRYGAYLQLGDDNEEGTSTHSLPHDKAMVRVMNDSANSFHVEGQSFTSMIGISLAEAVGYVALPRTVITLNDKPIVAAIGPYGPYLRYNGTFVSLNNELDDVLTVDGKRAEDLLREENNRPKRKAHSILAELGEKNGGTVTIKQGRFGSYLNWKKVNAKLPVEYLDSPEDLPLDEAWTHIRAKAGKASKRRTQSNGAAKTSVDMPAPPKRPMSAYLHFCASKRSEITAPGKSLGDVSKELSALWASVLPEDRNKFDEQASAGKALYESQRLAWEHECRALQGNETQRKTTTKEKMTSRLAKAGTSRPKRARSAYLYFCEANRAIVSHGRISFAEATKELARLWAETTDRGEFESLAAKDKIRYKREREQMENTVDKVTPTSI